MVKPEIGKYYCCVSQFFSVESIDRVDAIDKCNRITMVRLWGDGNFSYFEAKSLDFLRNTWDQNFAHPAIAEEVDDFRNRAAESRKAF